MTFAYFMAYFSPLGGRINGTPSHLDFSKSVEYDPNIVKDVSRWNSTNECTYFETATSDEVGRYARSTRRVTI